MLGRILIFAFFGLVACADILVILPVSSKSHSIVGLKLAKELVMRGHKVTCISHFKQNGHENLTELILEADEDKLSDECSRFHFIKKYTIMEMFHHALDLNYYFSEKCLSSTQFQSVKTQKFDLVIYEMFNAHIYTALGYHFKCPVIMLNTVHANIFNNFAVGNNFESSSVPYLGSGFTSNMNLWQRVVNLYYNIRTYLTMQFFAIPRENELWQKYFGPKPHLKDLIYNASLMLAYSHPAINENMPLVQQIQEIGGLHINKPKPLPKDLQEFLDKSKDGVILVSMGSILKSILMPSTKKQAFTNTFANSNLDILWKYENTSLINGRNVKIEKWIPQTDVLAHPKVRAFISHCGALSAIEAVYFGVPLICVPVFWDQHKITNFAVQKGYGLRVPYREITEEKLTEALREIQKPKYKHQAQRQSQIFKNNPIDPLDKAIYWIEYVINFKGALHLRSPSLDLHWYQSLYLDAMAIFFVILTALYLSIKKLEQFLTKKIWKEKIN